MDLLERDDELDQLRRGWHDARKGAGKLVLVPGEAGAGKSALVESFVESLEPHPRVAWGNCDALQIPRALGPVYEIAAALARDGVGSTDASRGTLFSSLFARLSGADPGTVVVLEDLHWADEATLDFLRFIGRRIGRLACLFIATYRDDELPPTHSLRRALGEITGHHVQRVRVPPLSRAAVDELAAAGSRDGARVYAITGGNPFFVRELLSAAGAAVPQTVSDAVIARLMKCAPRTRALAELVSIMPGRADAWLVDAAFGDAVRETEELLGCGLLAAASGESVLMFRHELTRLAVESTLSAARARELHRRVLDALDGRDVDLARLVHHANLAGSSEAVLRYAPSAAREAARVGAHREAAAHFGTALAHSRSLPGRDRAELHELHSWECHLTNQVEPALTSGGQALALWRMAGGVADQARVLRLISRLHWARGDRAEADEASRQALALLETLPPGPDLAMAYSGVSQLAMLGGRVDEALEHGARALDLARRFADHATESHALNNIGAAKVGSGDIGGYAELERALDIALDHDLSEPAARAYVNLATCSVLRHDLVRAKRHIEAGTDYCETHEIQTHLTYLRAYAARLELELGHWDEAVRLARGLLHSDAVTAVQRIPALVTLALVRIRRGDPGVDELLDEGWRLAKPTGELQRIGRVMAARAEHAWYRGDDDAAADAAALGLEHAAGHRDPWITGELVWLQRCAGGCAAAAGEVAEPYRLMVEGDAQGAATLWRDLGMPYEQALALSGGDEPALREGLQIATELGAAPLAALIRRRLRSEGARGVPRGPRPSTRANPAGLTSREIQVLKLLVEGHSNAALARRLHLSPRTIHRHVSSILDKLGVRSRLEAASAAFTLGIAIPPR